MSAAVTTQMTQRLIGFSLPTAAREWVPRLTQADQASAFPVLRELLELEAEERRRRRIARVRQAARLSPGKTVDTLDAGRLPLPLFQQLQQLATGACLETATNVLAFGLPGVGKTHARCAAADALVQTGHRVLYTPAHALEQELLAAKRAVDLPRVSRTLDLFEATLLAERYERRSVFLTSNLVGTRQGRPVCAAGRRSRRWRHARPPNSSGD